MSIIKWIAADNAMGDETLKQHAMIPAKRRYMWTGDEYEGNISLCGNVTIVGEDGISEAFDLLEREILNPITACRTCVRLSVKESLKVN